MREIANKVFNSGQCPLRHTQDAIDLCPVKLVETGDAHSTSRFDFNISGHSGERLHHPVGRKFRPVNDPLSGDFGRAADNGSAGAGDPGEGSQLILVGMMIDKAEINIEDNEVSLVLYKHFD